MPFRADASPCSQARLEWDASTADSPAGLQALPIAENGSASERESARGNA